MRVTYDGPLDGVELAVPGGRGTLTVWRGDTIEVPDEVGLSLIRQDIWSKAPEPKKPAKADDTPKEDD